MAFKNPIVGGLALIRKAIRSPNFVPPPNLEGWSIERDGSVFFGSIVVNSAGGQVQIVDIPPGTAETLIIAGTIRLGDSGSTTPAEIIGANSNGSLILNAGEDNPGDAASLRLLKDGDAQLFRNGDDVLLAFDAWEDFTPTISGVTLGNGSRSGRYKQIGKTVHASAELVIGTTTNITGPVFLGLPVGANGADPTQPIVGVARHVEAGVRRWAGMCAIVSNGGAYDLVAMEHAYSSGGGVVQASAPFVWGNGDSMRYSITYEAA